MKAGASSSTPHTSKSCSGLSDAELIKAFQKGDQPAFEALVHRYEKPVFGYVFLRIKDYAGTEDVIQETFLRVYGSLTKRRFKWRVSKPGGFAGWVFATARNCFREWLRDNRSTPTQGSSLDQVALETSATQKTETQKQEALAKLKYSLEQLPEEYYLVLSLKYQQGLTCAEIAKTLGQPIGTVTSNLTRAYKLLRQDPELAK